MNLNESTVQERKSYQPQRAEWDVLTEWREAQERLQQKREFYRGEIGAAVCREAIVKESARNFSIILGVPALALAAELLPDSEPEVSTESETAEANVIEVTSSLSEDYTLHIYHDERNDYEQNLKLAA